ncbi:MAG: SDR family NAD(P)-dependent oxidoreductase [Candidatus Acidiferrales bacterium]
MLEGKVAFITGSTRGIGWATARTFAAQGASLILNGVTAQERVDARVAEIGKEFGVPCIGFLCDVSNPACVRSCYSEIFKKFKRLDVLVNNAGIVQDALLGMIPEASIRRQIEVNTMGSIFNLQEASRLMVRNRAGSIINVSSIVGRMGNAGETVYSASKAAILGLTFSAAKELAPKNIRVNAIAPGFIDTDLTKVLPKDAYADWSRRVGLGRIGTPQEVANTILFLASDQASHISGQVLGVDGCLVI